MMENVYQNLAFDREQAESALSEPNQETLRPDSGPPTVAFIEFRRQQLHNRRDLLMQMLHLRKKAEEDNNRSTEEMSGEDNDHLSELEAIQKELEELQLKEKNSKVRLDYDDMDTHCLSSNMDYEMPRGGIYMLPHPQLTSVEVLKTQPEKPTGLIIPVDSLKHTPAVTRCPSCDEVITTITHSTVSEEMWILCFLSSMLGCVAGCCLIPFFMNSLKKVHHQCPRCQSNIHTHRPI